MATSTLYYNLQKPEYTDPADIQVLNGNTDQIDTQMHLNKVAADQAAANEADAYDAVNGSYNPGDIRIYENVLYICAGATSGAFDPTKWTQTTIAAAFEPQHTWTLLETITADGTTFQYIRDLPAKTSGIMVICYFKATTQTATHFRAEISFDGTNYNMYAYIGNAITNADRYGRLNIIRDGNLWTGYSTQAGTSDTAITQTQEINNACIVTNDAIQKIKLRSTSGQTNIESGSSFEIYIRR